MGKIWKPKKSAAQKDVAEAGAEYRWEQDLEVARADTVVNDFAVMKLRNGEGHVEKNLQITASERSSKRGGKRGEGVGRGEGGGGRGEGGEEMCT
jgi:hypothetical protein